MISDLERAGETAVRVGASLDLSALGLEGLAATVSWLHGDTPDRGPAASPDEHEIHATVDYRPEVPGLENVWLRLRYAHNDRDAGLGGRDREDFRFILNYAYRF